MGANRDFVVYATLVVVGLLATWGSFTPLGHVFQHIPLFGSTRLQSRNIVLVDLGATALLGWWLDRLQERDLAGAGLRGTPTRPHGRSRSGDDRAQRRDVGVGRVHREVAWSHGQCVADWPATRP